MSRADRIAMVDRSHAGFSVARQCALLGLSRSSVYYRPAPADGESLELMRRMGLEAIYQRPRTSQAAPDHRIYPYLLRNLEIERVNQVWCADITFIPMARSFLYLVAVMDWVSRRVLPWRLSNTLDAAFCIEALEEAVARHGRPDVFNTDQGSQFTSTGFTKTLAAADIAISMDGKGRFTDNLFVERLWRSLKYEEVYLHAYDMVAEAR